MTMSTPYYRGNPRVSSGYMTPREVANEMRYIASVIPLDSYRADDRRFALVARASDIDAGQHNPKRHFTVFIPCERHKVKGRWIEAVTLPCSGHPPYTFDESWLVLEAYAARLGWNDTDPEMDALDCWAEGDGQNMDLGCLYDGIADPIRA